VSESSVVVAPPPIPGVTGDTGDVEPPPFKEVAEDTLRATRSTASSDEPVGVLFPGSDGIVGICCCGIFAEQANSSD
jgi:hypothetical protein